MKGAGMEKRNGVALFIFGLFIGVYVLFSPMRASYSGTNESPFPDISGWKPTAEVETYSPTTLYEYIDGAADLYLAYDFEELKVADFKSEKKGAVTLEIYRLHSPTDAFGIYSQERLPASNYISIGAQGYIDKNMLNFIAGPYYVKINSFDTGAEDQKILLAFAGKTAESLEKGEQKAGLPRLLAAFPEEGKVKNSEKYISKKFLGYSFFHSAFIADYSLGGKTASLFVMEGADQNDCRDMLQKYFQQIGRTQTILEEGRYTLTDPHHGEIDFFWKGKYVWGALNFNDSGLRSNYLTLFEAGLQVIR
jgi:hypothetical protein